ncbi:MAG: AsnC family transcriptional regulator [Hyphomicrobiaceae bacterium]|nr:AsnC family transcriptional regulator [Hyphomicrobiaceae bacterium]
MTLQAASLGDNAMPAVAPQLFQLLDGWQRAFPLVQRPYAAVGRAVGLDEDSVLDGLGDLSRAGVLGRVGATIRPNTIGASMLAAMSVPAARLDEVAAIVNAEPGVNHNYEREHAINLWFVIAATDAAALTQSLNRIRVASGLDILELPLERAYYIDLGFSLSQNSLGQGRHEAARAAIPAAAPQDGNLVDAVDHRLLGALERGLMLVPRPYLALGTETGLEEAEVMARIARLLAIGVITRFGIIVRHRRLGYRANAMVVFDVEDSRVDAIGEQFARQPFVTLCYRRPRHEARWPYNLFCMVHGQERTRVLEQVARLAASGGSDAARHAVLFSRRCYLQRGTRIAHDGDLQREAAQ